MTQSAYLHSSGWGYHYGPNSYTLVVTDEVGTHYAQVVGQYGIKEIYLNDTLEFISQE